VAQDEVKLFFGFGVHPAADSTLARKCESVFAVAVDSGAVGAGVVARRRAGEGWRCRKLHKHGIGGSFTERGLYPPSKDRFPKGAPKPRNLFAFILPLLSTVCLDLFGACSPTPPLQQPRAAPPYQSPAWIRG
jgi:hypothetical protein